MGTGDMRAKELDTLEKKCAMKKELEELDLIVQKEHDKFKESLAANMKAAEQARRQVDLETNAALREHKTRIERQEKRVAELGTTQKTFKEESKRRETEIAKKKAVVEKKTDELETKFKALVDETHAATDEARDLAERERKRQDAERSQLAVQIYKQFDALGARVDGNEAEGRTNLESKAASLLTDLLTSPSQAIAAR